jgi:hypothetical protein
MANGEYFYTFTIHHSPFTINKDSMIKEIQRQRLPFTISKEKLRTFFLNESGAVVSRTTFAEKSGVREFCLTELGMTDEDFRKRKGFYGGEVTKILAHFQIEIDEL